MYAERTITNGGTEYDFIKAFTGAVIADGNGLVTLELPEGTTLQDLFEMTTSKTAEFTLNFNGWFKLRFVRADNNGRNGSNYTINRYFVSANRTDDRGTIQFTSLSPYIDESATRSYSYQLIANDNAIAFVVKNYDRNASIPTFCVKGSKNNYGITGGIASMLDSTTQTSNTVVDRMPYIIDSAETNKIEIVKNKVYHTNNVEVFRTTGLWDCSTITSTGKITVDNISACVLDSHTIMPY